MRYIGVTMNGRGRYVLFRPRARAVSAMFVDYCRFIVAQGREEESEEKDETPRRRGVDGRRVIYVQSLIAFCR